MYVWIIDSSDILIIVWLSPNNEDRPSWKIDYIIRKPYEFTDIRYIWLEIYYTHSPPDYFHVFYAS